MVAALLTAPAAIALGEDSDARVAVPDAAAQMKTLGEVKQIFADDYAKAKKPEDKNGLARNLLKQAEDQKDDPVARYVLFKEALRLAQDGVDPETSLACIESLGKEYQVDSFAMLHDVLDDLSKKAKTPQVLKAINDANKDGIDKAVAADKFAVAVKMCVIGDRLSLAAKDTGERKRYLDVKTAVLAQQKEFDAAERAKEILATNPDDATANFDRGVYMLSRKGDWQAGLNHLAKSGDSELRSLAKLDLSNPESAKKRLELAEGWFEWTPPLKKTKPVWSKALAKYWYSQIANEVTGLEKTKVEKRLKEIGELDLKRDDSGIAVAKSVIKQVEPQPMPRVPMNVNVPRQPMPNVVVNVPRNNPIPAAPAVVIRPLGKLPPVGELPPKVEAKNPFVLQPLAPLSPEQTKLTREVFQWALTTPGVQLTYAYTTPTASGSKMVGVKNREPEPDGLYAIVGINSQSLTDDQFKMFKGLTTIDSVYSRSPGSTGGWIKHLEAATHLRSINVGNSQNAFSDDYAGMLTKFPNLMSFSSIMSPVGPKVVKALAECPAITAVALLPGPTLKPIDIAALRRTHLEELMLYSAADAHVLAIEGAPDLKLLHLSNSVMSDAGISQLQSIGLESLTMYQTSGFTGEGFKGWNPKALKWLTLGGCPQVSNQGMAAIAAIPNLKTLKLGQIFSPLNLSKVASASSLEALSLEEVPATNWDALSEFTNLKSISFRGIEIPESAFKILAKLPLQSLHSNNCNLSDAHFKALVGHPSLNLVTAFNCRVTQDAVQALKAANPRVNVFGVK